jgi:hypothetical protein
LKYNKDIKKKKRVGAEEFIEKPRVKKEKP